MLYRDWIRGESGASRADQLLGSGVIQTPEASRQHAYLAVLRVLSFFTSEQGGSCDRLGNVCGQWSNLIGVGGTMADGMLWMTAAFAKILETRCFFYCLKEHCQADLNRIRNVTRDISDDAAATLRPPGTFKVLLSLGWHPEKHVVNPRDSHRSCDHPPAGDGGSYELCRPGCDDCGSTGRNRH